MVRNNYGMSAIISVVSFSTEHNFEENLNKEISAQMVFLKEVFTQRKFEIKI